MSTLDLDLDQRNGFKNTGLAINGARPTPLRINKNSSHIHKRPSKKPSEPVIIYAVSPKVIHTRPQDFMALVQRLTGLDSSQSGWMGLPISAIDDPVQGYDYDDGGSSDDDQKIIDVVDHINIKEESIGSMNNIACYLVSPTMFIPPNKASIGDIPLYTPTGRDWDF